MFAHRSTRITTLSLVALASLGLASAALTGCAVGTLAGPAPAQSAAIEGTVFGGSLPIVGANVTLWETDLANTGYPSATSEQATLVQTVQTVAGGSFSFNAHTCGTQTATTSTGGATAGPFLYITSTGGNTGAGANTNAVLVEALGPCSYIETNRANLKVRVNEATTVAAALALGHFMYVDTTSQNVYIDAPANNNATTGSCSGTGSSMKCVAAGFSHAFANAFNLVDAMHFDGTAPGGSARSTLVANPMTGTAGNSTAIVPQAEINALANIIEACINSGGGSGTSGSGGGTDGSSCGNFFALAPTASGTVPTDTTTATLNVVQNPSHNVGSATANGLFQLIPAQPLFQPTLSTYPHDWSFAIFYPGTTATFSQPQAVALDANDNVYVPAIIASGSNPVNGSLTSFSSAGVQNWTTGNNSTICGIGSVATDTASNVWVANYTSSSFCTTGTAGLYGFSQSSSGSAVTPTYNFNNASTENVQGATWAVAVDRFNNLWYGRKNSTCYSSAGTGANTNPVCVAEVPYNSGAYGPQTNLQTFVSGTNIQGEPLNNVIDIVVDASQNVWAASYEDTATASPGDLTLGVIPNTGTAAAPTYSGASTPASTAVEDFGMLAIDGSGAAWSGAASSIFNYTVTNAGVVSTQNPAALGNGSITASKPQGGEFDGNGKLFFTSETSSGQIWFYSSANAAASDVATVTAGNLVPCYLPSTSSTTCTVGTGYPRSVQIDSTGALWGAAPNLSIGSSSAAGVGTAFEMLGVAAPTWPQLSYAKFGVTPQ